MGGITDNREFYTSLRYLGIWSLTALFAGAVGSAVVAGFHWGVLVLQEIFLSTGLPPLAFAVGGAALAGTLTRLDAGSRGEGIPSYIRGVKEEGGVLSPRITAVKAASAFATLASWGSGGYIGPLGRVVSGLTSTSVAMIAPAPGDRSLRRTAAICGLSATVAAVTGAPVGGGVFAVEIVQKRNMRYSDLFPAVLSGCVSVFLANGLFGGPIVNLTAEAVRMGGRHLPAVLLTVLLAGFGCRAFELFYEGVSKAFRRESGRAVEVRFAAAAALSVGLILAVNPAMLGTGGVFLREIFLDAAAAQGRLGPAVPTAVAVLLMMLVRASAVVLTVGSGQSAGFFAPLSQIGMLLGTFTAVLFGMHGNPGDLHVLQAVGFAGLVAGSLNVPVAAAIIVTETFGAPFGLVAALASVMVFQINRRHTVYDFEMDS